MFFGGDAAFGPENIITAAAHGHQAAISIHLFLEGKDLILDRPAPTTNLLQQKMGIHEWMYDSAVPDDDRYAVPHEDKKITLNPINHPLIPHATRSIPSSPMRLGNG